MFRQRSNFPAFAKWLTGLLLFHVFAATLLAANPALHELIHRHHHLLDGGQSGGGENSDQDCAVLMIAHGHCDSLVTTTECPAPAAGSFAGFVLQTAEDPVSLALGGAALGRAPPLQVS